MQDVSLPLAKAIPRASRARAGQMACINIEADQEEHLPVNTQKQGAARHTGSCAPTTSQSSNTSCDHHPLAPGRRTKSVQFHTRQWPELGHRRSRLPWLLLTSMLPSKQKCPWLQQCRSCSHERPTVPHYKTSNGTNRHSLSPNSLSQNTQMQTKKQYLRKDFPTWNTGLHSFRLNTKP